ncbi:MAG: hypothetical protein L0J09_11360 [Lactococcus lactis]|nr:hypothetical protein [Lactococcus lactis]
MAYLLNMDLAIESKGNSYDELIESIKAEAKNIFANCPKLNLLEIIEIEGPAGGFPNVDLIFEGGRQRLAKTLLNASLCDEYEAREIISGTSPIIKQKL